jgi:hypothetical protein
VVSTVKTRTDADGQYRFDNLLLDESYTPGGSVDLPQFKLSVTQPDGSTVSQAKQGTDRAKDSNDPLDPLTDVVRANQPSALFRVRTVSE